jgi:hypothetical protein
MSSRGIDKELANYYDQAVERGAILVAVEAKGRGAAAALARAERILEEAGSLPMQLPEG